MKEMNFNHITSESGNKSFYSVQRQRKKKKDPAEFQKILESYLVETAEDLEEYHILFPQHGHYWDNGYEDIG
jgi:hypothetical protein